MSKSTDIERDKTPEEVTRDRLESFELWLKDAQGNIRTLERNYAELDNQSYEARRAIRDLESTVKYIKLVAIIVISFMYGMIAANAKRR